MAVENQTISSRRAPTYPLPDGVGLTAEGDEHWERLTRLLPHNTGPRVLFVAVDRPLLRQQLHDHLAQTLEADGHRVARLELSAPSPRPLHDLFDLAAQNPDARFLFLLGLEQSLTSFDRRHAALYDLNVHRDQIHDHLACPLVIWTTNEAVTHLSRHAVDFFQWRAGVFDLSDPQTALEVGYRQHVIDRLGRLTLYSTHSDAPLAVDLERVFVKLTLTERCRDRRRRARLERDLEEPPLDEERVVAVPLEKALGENKRLALLGAPGAGKTTVLRYLALCYARHRAEEHFGLTDERLPVFVALRDLVRHLPEGTIGPEQLTAFLRGHMRSTAPHLDLPDDFFANALAEGRCAVLFDGLDEVADPVKRGRVAEAVSVFAHHYHANRFVVTSRPRAYEGHAGQRLSSLFAECTVQDLDEEGVQTFCRDWYRAVTRGRLGETQEADAEAQRQSDELLSAIRADEHVKPLARNPLLLSVLAMVHQRGVGLPRRRVELYDECTDMLLGYWDRVKGEAGRELAELGGFTRSEKRSLLEPVALWFHERGEQGLEAGKDELIDEAAKHFRELFGEDETTARKRAEVFLQIVDERAGLLEDRKTGTYAFSHLTFQEYLAARAIADRDDYIEYTLKHLHDPWWQEVTLLEVGHLSDVRHFGQRARKLTTDLIRAIREAGSWLEEVLKRDLLFAVRCVCDAGRLGVEDGLRNEFLDQLLGLWRSTPYGPQRQEIDDLIGHVQHAADRARVEDALIEASRSTDEVARAAAARSLGHLGSGSQSSSTLQRLAQLVEEHQPLRVRVGALEGLAALNPTQMPEALLARLCELAVGDHPSLRYLAAEALAAAAPDAAADGLARLVRSDSPDTRAHVAEALGQLGDSSRPQPLIQALLDLTADDEAHVRCDAARALGSFGRRAATERGVQRLQAMRRDPDADVRRVARWALVQLNWELCEAVVSESLSGTADPSADVRCEAVNTLTILGESAATAEVIGHLVTMTEDPSDAVRFEALRALRQMGEAASTPAIQERVAQMTGDASRSVQFEATRTLAHMAAWAVPATIVKLIELSRDQDVQIRSACAWGLGRTGSPTLAAVDHLTHMLADSFPADVAAGSALMELGSASSNDDLTDRLTSFWCGLLTDNRHYFNDLSMRYGRLCDVAYEELGRLR